MKILFLTFYYAPDLCAGSFRNTPLSKVLADKLPDEGHVEVITTMPSRYPSFRAEAQSQEEFEKLSVRRINIPQHDNGMVGQAVAFFVFAREAIGLLDGVQCDLVYASSSRLMTAFLGAYIARKRGALLYLDIRDIFVDTIGDVLPGIVGKVLTPLFSLVEKWTVESATKVNVVSEGFSDYFKSRYPSIDLSFYTNGIDSEFLDSQGDHAIKGPSNGIVNILYAGNFGESQGLHTIIPALAEHFGDAFQFKLIGDGGRKQQLIAEINKAGIKNVEVCDPISRSQLIEEYKQADVLFLHLNELPAFLKVIPSKVFEYAAMGKPIWAGVAGFSATFLRDNVENVALFPPCNVNEAISGFGELRLSYTDRRDFIEKYTRASIMSDMAEEIIDTTGKQ